MSGLVNSSQFTVRSKGFRWFINASTNSKIIGQRLIMVVVACILWNFSFAVAYGADAPPRTPNAEVRTANSQAAEGRFAQAGETRTDSVQASPFDGIKKTYADIRTLETKFNQRIVISSLKKERESKGEFFFKRQKGFLWRYTSPKVQYFLFDSNYLWQGEDEKPFVIKDKINKEKTDGTFFDLIEDIGKIDELFTLKEQKMAGELEMMELVPKKEGTVNSAKVWIDKQRMIKKIEMIEFTGNINTIEFSGIKVNQPLDDRKLIFKRDTGKEIVER